MAKHFEIRTKSGGNIKVHNISANSEAEARRLLTTKDSIISIKKHSSFHSYRAMGQADRIMLLRRLSMMTRSGLGLSKSLQTMKESFSGPISRVCNDLHIRVFEGDELDEAMASMPADFPPTTVSLVRSGMHGGELHAALANAADFEYEMHTIGAGAKGGLIEAGIEFLIAIGLIIGTAYVAAPKALESPIYAAAGDAVDIGWAFLTADILAILSLGIVIFLFVLFMVSYVFKPLAPNFSDAFTLKVPVFRDLVLSKNYYSVFYGLSLLIKSGVRLKTALTLAYQGAPSGAIAQDLRNAIEAIEEGEDWGSQMKRLHETDRACLTTSQDRSDIANALSAVADGFRDTYKHRVDQVVPALRALSNVFMFIAGFLIFAMLMLPSLQATKGLL